jgi:hypothetical protein
MRSTSLIVPLDFTIDENSITDEGVRQMSTASGTKFTVRLLKQGEALNDSTSALSFRYIDGEVSGNHTLRNDPPEDGYMPYSFYEPFQFQVAYSATPAENDWVGQSSLLAREFKKTSFVFGPNENFGSIFNSVRLLQYNQDLYHLVESYTWSTNRKIGVTSLFKYDPVTETSSLVKKFLEFPIISFDPYVEGISTYQQVGSPDWCVYEGYLYIAYRIHETSTGKESFIVWRSNDEDLTDWEVVSKTEVRDTVPSPLTNFRLRIASGDGTIMVVFYAQSLENRDIPTTTPVKLRDMRVFVSFDGGSKFNSRQQSFKNIRATDGGELTKVPSGVSLDSYFIPEVSGLTKLSHYNGFNEVFDLYFDLTMGSFVILKPGSPPGLLNNGRYLMGIKTLDDDYFNWEPCLKLLLDQSMTGDTPDGTSPWNPYEEGDDSEVNSLEILDLVVVPSETIHTIVFTGQRVSGDHSSTNPIGVGVAQFSFVRNSQVPLGNFETIYGYGGKFHPDYIFSSTPFNFDQNGLVGTGNAFTSPLAGYSLPCATTYRGQVAASCKVDYGIDFDGYRIDEFRFLAILKPWSNVNEVFGYEFAHSRMMGSLEDWNHTVFTVGTGGHTYDDTVYGDKFTGSGVGTAYAFLDNGASTLNVIERASISRPFFCKTKFQVKFNSFTTGSLEFLYMGAGPVGSIRGLHLEAFGGGSGVIDVKTPDGTVVDTMTGFDWDNEYEFMCGASYNKSKQNSIWVFYRVKGSDQWLPGSSEAVSETTGAVADGYFAVGVITRSSTTAEVVIGDVQIGALCGGYRKPFFDSKVDPPTWQDGGGFWTATPASYDDPSWAPPVKSFSPIVELQDGSIIEVGGTSTDLDAETSWDYSKTLSRNSTRNVLDGVADNAYDFTSFYNASAGTQRCVCYKTETPEVPTHDSEGELIVFENRFRAKVDAFSLININGIHCFEVIFGEYVTATDVWTTSEVVPYSIPRIVLEVSATVGRRIVITNKEFVQDQVKQFSVLLYDTVNQFYIDQFQVVENYGDFLELNKTIPSLTDRELHLMYQSASYQIDPAIVAAPTSHIGFRIFTPEDAELKSIGQIVLGTYIDLTEEISTIEVKEIAVDKNIMSKFGFAFMPRTYPGNVVEALDIKVPTISTRSGSFAKLKSLLFQLYKSKAPFTVLQQENDSENATYFGVLDSPTPKPDKYGHSFDFKVFTQNWRPRTLTRVVNEPPSLVITADNQNPAAGVSVAYTSTTVDPQGTAVTMLWEWSDDFTSVLDNPTRSFLEEGTYLLTATATNAGGASTSRTMLMEVGKPNTYRLVAEANGGVGSPFALNTAIYVEVQLHDSDGQVLVQDSTTQLIAVPEGNLTVDLDQNGIFSVYPDDIGPRVFEQGEIFLDVKTAVAGTYDLTLIDTFGNQVVIPITFA